MCTHHRYIRHIDNISAWLMLFIYASKEGYHCVECVTGIQQTMQTPQIIQLREPRPTHAISVAPAQHTYNVKGRHKDTSAGTTVKRGPGTGALSLTAGCSDTFLSCLSCFSSAAFDMSPCTWFLSSCGFIAGAAGALPCASIVACQIRPHEGEG